MKKQNKQNTPKPAGSGKEFPKQVWPIDPLEDIPFQDESEEKENSAQEKDQKKPNDGFDEWSSTWP